MSIQWTDDLALGIAEIDGQHKELFAHVNALLDAAKARKGKDEIDRLFQFLDDYTREHFTFEESLQRSAGYPRLEEHRKMHEGFIRTLAMLKARHAENGDSLSLRLQVNQFVVDWLVKHISHEDVDLARYVKR